MLKLRCLCGQIHIEINRSPDFINECNCTLCSKLGVRWAYFDPSDVSVAGITTGYSREDKADPAANIRFCPRCGSTTHFALTERAVAKFGNGMMGVNMRLADQIALAGVELRYPDGRAWQGEGDFGYVRDPRILGDVVP